VLVVQPSPAHRDLRQGVLDQVLGAVVVAAEQDRGAQERLLSLARPTGERLGAVPVRHSLTTPRSFDWLCRLSMTSPVIGVQVQDHRSRKEPP
jgi:hypothetical protein